MAKKTIMITGFHEAHIGDEWLRQPLVVMGGGDYFFVASYSLRSDKVTSIRINAPK
jgi:hypothetical protein